MVLEPIFEIALFRYINQYSYIFVSFAALAALVFFLMRRNAKRRVIVGAGIGLLIFLIGGYVLLRPGLGDVDNVTAAETIIENGNPTFLEFYSNYCAGCLSVRPLVDSTLANIEGEYNIMRVDIHTNTGRALRERYGFSYTPEFILFDTTGQEVWRGHLPPSQMQLTMARNSTLNVPVEGS